MDLQPYHKAGGDALSDMRQKNTACIRTVTTPIGRMLAAVNDNHLCLLEFIDQEFSNQEKMHQQMARVQQRLGVKFVVADHELFETLQNQLNEYFNHQRRQFDIPLSVAGTGFQRSAWAFLQSIPYAQTRYYQQEAEWMGNPAAVRAVGRANGRNALAILIPCHRVVAKNGSLSGYAGGVSRKQFLLDLEQAGLSPL